MFSLQSLLLSWTTFIAVLCPIEGLQFFLFNNTALGSPAVAPPQHLDSLSGALPVALLQSAIVNGTIQGSISGFENDDVGISLSCKTDGML